MLPPFFCLNAFSISLSLRWSTCFFISFIITLSSTLRIEAHSFRHAYLTMSFGISPILLAKSAISAALFIGSSANGVVIITTKGGKKNNGMKVDYSGYVGVDRIRKGVYDVMDSEQYGQYMRMA